MEEDAVGLKAQSTENQSVHFNQVNFRKCLNLVERLNI